MKLVTAVVAVCLPLLAADRVVLKNGDIVSGSIVKKDGDKLTIHSEFMGDLMIPWSAVANVDTENPLTVALPEGEIAVGPVSTNDGYIEVAGRSVPLRDVVAMRNRDEQRAWERLQRAGVLHLWTGFIDLGLALARGNARTDTLTGAMNATRTTANDKIALKFQQIYGTARVGGTVGTIASVVRGGWLYNRQVTPRFFAGAFNDYEHDRFQNLDLRYVAGINFGAKVVQTEKATLSILGGGGYSRENFIDSLHRNQAELNFGDDFSYRFSSTTSLTQSFRIFPNVSDTGEYRMTFDLGGVTAIRRWLGWHVTASNRFMSNPVIGLQRNDVILSTGFRLSFAR